MNNFKALFYILAFSLFSLSCANDSQEDFQEIIEIDVDEDMTPVPVTYNNQVSAIMMDNCTRCHGIPLTNGAPFPLLTFDQVNNRRDRIISRMNNAANPMPPTGLLSNSVRAQVQQWIDMGALEGE